MEHRDGISIIGAYTFCLNVLPYSGYADQAYCLMRSLNSKSYQMWKKYELFLLTDLLQKRKIDRIYELLSLDDQKIINMMKLYQVFMYFQGEEH